MAPCFKRYKSVEYYLKLLPLYIQSKCFKDSFTCTTNMLSIAT